MEWMDAVQALVEEPWVRLTADVLVRGIARRVRRGRGSVAAHSEAGPATTKPDTEGTETAVTTVADDRTGEQLAESLLEGVGNEGMRAATRLLGAHRNGFWLRRLLEQEAEWSAAGTGQPVIDRSGPHPSVGWDAIGLLLFDQPWVIQASRSEMAVLEVAASLVRRCGVQLGSVVEAVDEGEFQLILRALQESAHGDAAR
ncbi:hypothetical protein [Streptomyces sampsonii]|uniref:hypothetical protein n=1 Tax=Streptomyces sampsonii TaxID=42239 RepID=UPI0008F4AF5D|nr:hypothetical protein [Streptomyces sampsonii]